MKLNLGAGYEDLGKEWTRVDLDPDTDPNLLGDVRDLHWIDDETIDEIRAVDILEHLSYRDTVPALKEWARVLKPGGTIFLQVPAADLIMQRWFASRAQDSTLPSMRRGLPPDVLASPLMVQTAWRLLGGHFDEKYTRDDQRWYLNAHHALFDVETIRWAAKEAGLTVRSISTTPHPNYTVWLRKP